MVSQKGSPEIGGVGGPLRPMMDRGFPYLLAFTANDTGGQSVSLWGPCDELLGLPRLAFGGLPRLEAAPSELLSSLCPVSQSKALPFWW